MPLGVPKVLEGFIEKEKEEVEKEEDPSWIELYHRLYEKRYLFLGKPLDEDLGNRLVGIMVHLAIKDRTKEQFLFIHCPGGLIIPGIALYDAMHYVPTDINTIVVGFAASMGSLVLTGGHPGKRMAFPNAEVMVHQPASCFEDGFSKYSSQNDEDVARFKELVVDIYMQTTKKTDRVDVWKDLERDEFLSAKETLEYGIIDLILDSDMIPPWMKDQISDESDQITDISINEDGDGGDKPLYYPLLGRMYPIPIKKRHDKSESENDESENDKSENDESESENDESENDKSENDESESENDESYHPFQG
uniref:ATP-dependent Clp protease proteolytic subunit n=1 Tax=Parasitaxus usta TaxID=56899 RepID=A0A5J6CE33_9CONI|nr:clp protease proteolytic subunit [Parasitaxus usta]QEQ14286.1 clp protease proteolytic subunit [Parasitaxus usta]